MLNNVTIMGRLVNDPEVRYAGSENYPVASFRIACDRDYKDKNGEKQADFISCVAWRGTADFISKYFSKGRMIVIDGRLQSRSWEDPEKGKRSVVEIVVENAYFGDSKREGDERASSGANPGYVKEKDGGVSVDANGFEEAEGELPF